MESIQLDNSGRQTAEQCKMKYFLKNIQGLHSDYGSTALRYGQTWHGIMEGYYKTIKELGWKNKDVAIAAGIERGKKIWDRETEELRYETIDYRTFENCVMMFMDYVQYFAADESSIEIISTEKKFEIPIIPETEEELRLLSSKPTLLFTGKIDLQVEMDGRIWGVDHKTTSFDIGKASLQLNRSAQFIGYYFAESMLKEGDDSQLEGFLISFAYASSYKSKATGSYGEVKTDFRRIPQLYTKQDVLEWKKSFIGTYLGIVFCKENEFWPVQYDSCYNQYNRSCEYLRLCDQKRPFKDLNLQGYHVKHWNVLDSEEE
jgi:hypothetical protein